MGGLYLGTLNVVDPSIGFLEPSWGSHLALEKCVPGLPTAAHRRFGGLALGTYDAFN